MNETLVLTQIKSYLARLKTEVTISNASNETDINIHIENIISRILSILFNCKISNSNRAIKKNQESFDLFDEAGIYAFQITSTNMNTKIINSVSAFINYSWHQNFKELYVVLIGYDKKQYNKSTLTRIESITQNKFLFDIRKNIIDINDIYDQIKGINNFKAISEINNILREQFEIIESEGKISNLLVEFLDEYKESIFIKYRRINFFGLDVSSKPNEVDLESLFVASYFKKHSKALSSAHSYKNGKINYFLDDLFLNDESKNLEIRNFDANSIPGIKILEPYKSSFVFRTSALELAFSKIGVSDSPNRHPYSSEEDEKYTIQDFFSFINHTVILGNPGAGKSSLVKYITLKILRKNSGIFSNNEALDYFPFRVELYKYDQNKKLYSDNIFNYLLKYIQQDLSVKSISNPLLTHILNKVNCLIFFDGLDEIFDVQDRIDVRNDIEIFIKNFPKCKVVVTSRFESGAIQNFVWVVLRQFVTKSNLSLL